MRENHSAQQLIQLPSVNRDSPKNHIDASISVIWVFFCTNLTECVKLNQF